MDPDLLAAFSRQRFLGVPVEAHARLGSTNDEAFRRAREGAPEGLVVVALDQTAGRGRLGRSWFGSKGQSLLFSVLLYPELPLPSYPLLSLALAASIADAGSEAIAPPGARLTIKWPNDVLHDGRKLCGVLAESRSLAAGARPALVIGAGINVNQAPSDFPPEIRDRATSLRGAAGGPALDLVSVLRASLEGFGREVEAARAGGARALHERLRGRLPARGSPVRVVLADRAVEGAVEEVTETGALRVRDARTGAVETLAAGVLE